MPLLASPSRKSERLGSIDSARGAAMLFVFLSHFDSAYLWRADAGDLAGYLGTLGMIASPTFVTVSGLVAGFLAATNPARFRDLRIKLLDRGLFLLVVGHSVLALAVLSPAAGFAEAFRTSFITDAIAVSVIVGPWLVGPLSGSRRIAIAAATFLLNWWAVIQWHPSGVALVFKQYFIGISGAPGVDAPPFFAVIPWLAVYIAATVLGERVGRMYRAGEQRKAHNLLARIGAASFLIAGTFHFGEKLLQRFRPDLVPPGFSVMTLFSIYEKFPPGPIYLGFFGGIGALLLAAVLELDRRRRLPTVMQQLKMIGGASLFVFIAQFVLYVAILQRLRLPYTPLWPVLFVITVIILAKGAALWSQYDCNRFLTLGLVSFFADPERARSAKPLADGRTEPLQVPERAVGPLPQDGVAPRQSITSATVRSA